MTEQDSSSSQEPSFPPSTSPEPHVYKAIIAIGVTGTEEMVTRFTALWIKDSEKRAHQIAKLYEVQLLPLPEPDAEVQ